MRKDILSVVPAILLTSLARWQHLIDALPVELLNRRPIAGEWSATECLWHLINTEECVFAVRLHAFVTGQDIVAYNELTPREDELIPSRLIDEFIKLRTENLTALRQIHVQDLARRVHHSELGSVKLEEMLNEWATHDLIHTVQAERAIMQYFIGDSGPWRAGFQDNDMDANK